MAEKQKKVIVPGGAGFIGTNFCKSALARGCEVVVFDNLSRAGAEQNLEYLDGLSDGRLHFIKGNVETRSHVEDLFSQHGDAGLILQLAGQVAVTTSIEDPRTDFESNLLGTFHLLEAMRAAGSPAAFIFASTNKVYGKLDGIEVEEGDTRWRFRDRPRGIDESVTLEFLSPYGCSKGAADQYVLDYARIYGLNSTVFRQSCIYGPHQFGIEDQGWVAWFLIAVLSGKPLTIYGDGKQVRDVLYVDDLVEAYWAAAENIERTRGQAYNIGGGEFRLSLLELIGMMKNDLGIPVSHEFDAPRPADQKVYVSDVRKALKDFAWKPVIPPDEGVSMLAKWVKINLSNMKIKIRE